MQIMWIITWIERRLEKGRQGAGDANLVAVEQLFGEIFHWFDGYDVSEMEQIKLDNTVEARSWMGRLISGHDSSVYGEVLPEGVQTLLDAVQDEIPMDVEDVFVDLGSGTGKVAMHAVLVLPCKKVMGIELSETRYNHGVKAIEAAIEVAKGQNEKSRVDDEIRSLKKTFAANVVRASVNDRLQLIHGDITIPIYNDATHLFAASTTWPSSLLEQVVELVLHSVTNCKTFSTLSSLSREYLKELKGAVYLWKSVQVAVSWSDFAPMHIYRFKKPHGVSYTHE